MTGHYFISYSNADGKDYALKLYDALTGGYPRLPCWLDKHSLKPIGSWDSQIAEALGDCAAVLFVVTPDSVHDASVCRQEIARALRYRKWVVPLLFQPVSDMPLQLESYQYIDFRSDFDACLDKLRRHLVWLDSDEGKLQHKKNELLNAERDLRRTRDELDERRIRADMEQLQQDIARLQQTLANPEAARQRADESIQRRIEIERQPVKPPQVVTRRARFINSPPMVAPLYFQDRHAQTREIGRFLSDPHQRMMVVVGRGGVGKTAMVCRLLASLETGHLPDDNGPMNVDGIVYLSAVGTRRLTSQNVLDDLTKLLPDEARAALEPLYHDGKMPVADKVQALLTHLPAGRVVLLLDNFEDVVDTTTPERPIRDSDLNEALFALMQAPAHAVKVLITSRVLPAALLLRVRPGLHRVLELDAGLESPYAENVLREMDPDGRLGLRNAPDATLRVARERTKGYPRALEALAAILSVDRSTSFDEIMNDAAKLLPETVVEVLVGEAFKRLDVLARRVTQAMAVFGRPVPSVAIDYLLQPYEPDIDSAPVLMRLLNMHFVRKEGSKYYLHPVDQQYALARLAPGEDSDRFEAGEPLFTRVALAQRGAEYFRSTRKERTEWRTLTDLQPVLDEFDLRLEAGDSETAAEVLSAIDSAFLHKWGYGWLAYNYHLKLRPVLPFGKWQLRNRHALGYLSYSLGRSNEALALLDEAGEIARQVQEPWYEVDALSVKGYCYAELGMTNEALRCYQQVLAMSRQYKFRQTESIALRNLGVFYKNVGRMQDAVNMLEQSLTLARQENDQYAESYALTGLGSFYSALGNPAEAQRYYEQALSLAKQREDIKGELEALESLRAGALAMGDYPRALDYARRVLALSTTDRRMERIALGSMGEVYLALQKEQQAVDAFQQALAIARDMNNPADEVNALLLMGWCYKQLGRHDEALETYEQGLGIARHTGDLAMQNNALYNLGPAYIQLKRYQDAIRCYEEKLTLDVKLNNAIYQLNTLWGLMECYAALENYTRVLDYGEQAVTLTREGNSRQAEMVSWDTMAYYAFEFGDLRKCVDCYHYALVIAREINDLKEEGVALENIGFALRSIGALRPAIAQYQQALAIQEQRSNLREQNVCLSNMGWCSWVLGEYETGERYLMQALDVAQRGNLPNDELSTMRGLALLDYVIGDAEGAQEWIRHIRTLMERKDLKHSARHSTLSLLALVALLENRLDDARAAIEQAFEYPNPGVLHFTMLRAGIIALRQGRRNDAAELFRRATARVDKRLAFTADLYEDLETKGLALCGLVLCGERERLPEAEAAFRAARETLSTEGAVKELLLYLNTLTPADTGGLLADVRRIASGR